MKAEAKVIQELNRKAHLGLFEPYIELCRKNRGLKAMIFREMIMAGIRGNWANLCGWFAEDRDNRRVPRAETRRRLEKLLKELKRDGKI